jgi:hypothetical protein
LHCYTQISLFFPSIVIIKWPMAWETKPFFSIVPTLTQCQYRTRYSPKTTWVSTWLSNTSHFQKTDYFYEYRESYIISHAFYIKTSLISSIPKWFISSVSFEYNRALLDQLYKTAKNKVKICWIFYFSKDFSFFIYL